jgi:hypothetical protein
MNQNNDSVLKEIRNLCILFNVPQYNGELLLNKVKKLMEERKELKQKLIDLENLNKKYTL